MTTTVTSSSSDLDGGPQAFVASRNRCESVLSLLAGDRVAGLEHGELERLLQVQGRALLCQLLQDHLDLRARREQRLTEVVDIDGVARPTVETGHQRTLGTVFGAVTVERMAYRGRGRSNLHPADGILNLPAGKHSHGLARLAAIESSRGSFDTAVDAIGRVCGTPPGKRQVEALTIQAAVDFDDFYTARQPPCGQPDDILVLSADGKGIVMRPDALRPATRKAAKNAKPNMDGRLSKGEKHGRKRMAEVGAVYDVTPAARSPDDVMASRHDLHLDIGGPVEEPLERDPGGEDVGGRVDVTQQLGGGPGADDLVVGVAIGQRGVRPCRSTVGEPVGRHQQQPADS